MFYLINLSLVSNNFSFLDLHVFSHGIFFRRKRKGSSKSSTKSNKRRASTIEVKLEPIVASPISLPKELDLPKTEISQPQDTLSNDHLQLPTQSTLGTPINN